MRPDRRRQLVDDVRSTWQVSIRRGCAVLRAERSSYHYRGKRADQAKLKQRIREIAETVSDRGGQGIGGEGGIRTARLTI